MRRALIVLVALVLALVAGPACEEPPRGIIVWHSYDEGGGEETALKTLATRFEKEHGTRITLLRVPYDAYLSKLEAAIPRGNGPDVFLGPHNRLGEYLLHRLVGEAGDAFPDEDVARFDPLTVDSVTVSGKRYAVPLGSKGLALYVNEEILPEAPSSIEELAAKKGSLGAGVWPLVYPTADVYFHVAVLHAYGGRFFGDDHFSMVGAAAEHSLEKVRQWTDDGVVPKSPDGALVTQLFANGKAATAIGGPWLAADLKSSLRYRVVALPKIEGAGKMRSYLTVEAAFLSPDGAASADARAFARFFASDATAGERARTAAQIVANTAFWQTPASRDPSLSLVRAFRDALTDAIPMPVSTAMNPAWDPAKQAILKVLSHDLDAHAALEQAKARYEDVTRPPAEVASGTPLVLMIGLALLLLAVAVVRRASRPGFREELRASMPAYKYVVHSAIAIGFLVVLPLVAGALTSFYAGAPADPRFVGFSHYVDILTVRGKPFSEWLSSGSFYLTLIVTVAWTIVNVALHVAIGLVLGVALARPFLRLRAVYRVLLILPWAVPSYVTALAWKGMFEEQYGAVNGILAALGARDTVSWFSHFSTAFTANVATNVWLGFPFMMVVVMGALTSIPKDVLEAAEVDGATRWQAFRRVTLPLLRPTLLPAVILGSVWTFNMFNVVFLVSGGAPDGTTDILVSEAYRWAFTRGSQLGYAAAYAVLIFGLLVVMSRSFSRAES